MPPLTPAATSASIDTPDIGSAGPELLALALMDARNHTLHLLAQYEQALGEANFVVPRRSELSSIDTSKSTLVFSRLAGDLSYAVYVMHWPVLTLVVSILSRAAPVQQSRPIAGWIFVATLLFGCWIADRVYDKPVRRWLTSRFRRADHID